MLGEVNVQAVAAGVVVQLMPVTFTRSPLSGLAEVRSVRRPVSNSVAVWKLPPVLVRSSSKLRVGSGPP